MLNHKANEFYLLIKMIAFNISNWFKHAVMPKDVRNHEISTLRRIFLRVSENICGNGDYKHISVAVVLTFCNIYALMHIISMKLVFENVISYESKR
jgi:hypothetical protein